MIVDLIRCSVDGCGWKHLRTIDPPAEDALARVFGPGVVRSVAIAQALHAAEDALTEHMATHTAAEFLTTITRLRYELNAPTTGEAAEAVAEAVDRVAAELEESVSEFVHARVDEHDGFDADTREAARIAVEVLLAHPTLLRALAAPQMRPVQVRR